jgi:glucosamine--fructose-6-phosphate aminotransferase (isomerizing)
MPLRFLEGPYLRDLLDQPAAVDAAAAGLRGCGQQGRILELAAPPDRRIVLTGMGSSLYALHPLRVALGRGGRAALMAETSELLLCAPQALVGSLLVVVSQSGRSAEIVRLVEARPERCSLIAVTNTPGSPLAEAADLCLWMRAGEEFSVASKSYVASLVVVAWLGELLSGDCGEEALKAIEAAVPWMHDYLSRWRDHASSLAARLEGVRHLFLTGRAASLAAALTGGLIIKEAAHFAAEGMSSAAFRHGPLEMIGPETLVLVFSGGAALRPANLRLVCDIRSLGGRAEVIGEEAELDALRLPPVAEAARPLVEILPVQMLTLALAALAGREAGRFERALKITTVE